MRIQTIGSYEAKTRLPELLRHVQAGQSFDISIRGQKVARLVPVLKADANRKDSVESMRTFMQSQNSCLSGSGLDLRGLIDDGRA